MSSFSWQPLQNSFPYLAKILAWLCPLRAQAARGCVGNSFLDWDKSLMDLLTKRSLKRPSKCLDWRYQVEDWDRDWKILPEWRLDCILGKPKLRGEEGWSGLRGCGGGCVQLGAAVLPVKVILTECCQTIQSFWSSNSSVFINYVPCLAWRKNQWQQSW